MHRALRFLSGAGCSVREKFRLYCPMCGGTRALNALLDFHPVQSVRYNPVVVMMVLCIAVLGGIHIWEHLHKGKRLYAARIHLCLTFPVIWLSYALIRDLLLLCFGVDLLSDFCRNNSITH